MRENLQQFIINPSASMMEAFQKIDKNKKGFLVVLDKDEVLFGTVTDGDIRRALLSGMTTEDKVENICNKTFLSICSIEQIGKVIELFKNEKIKFLPVTDLKNRLVNIITKSQLHALLLQDIYADLLYDFTSLDDMIIDYEIFGRPWGFYKTTVMNDYCQSKIICIYPQEQLSLQSHEQREEYWIVVHGKGIVQIGESLLKAECGASFFIPKGCRHRLMNTEKKESLIITEVQIGDYFGEDDICRYEDIYGRI